MLASLTPFRKESSLTLKAKWYNVLTILNCPNTSCGCWCWVAQTNIGLQLESGQIPQNSRFQFENHKCYAFWKGFAALFVVV